jgi:hypothetical protein
VPGGWNHRPFGQIGLCRGFVQDPESARPQRSKPGGEGYSAGTATCRWQDRVRQSSRSPYLDPRPPAHSLTCQTERRYHSYGPARRPALSFTAGTEEHPKAQVTARLTDDAGLHWQVDPDLHLEKLGDRDDW